MDDQLCADCGRRPVVHPRLGTCHPCKEKRQRAKSRAGLVVRDEAEFDYVRTERALRWLLYGEHWTPEVRKWTRAEAVWLVQTAVQAGETRVSRIREMLRVTTEDAQRIINEVTTGRRRAPQYDLHGRAVA